MARLQSTVLKQEKIVRRKRILRVIKLLGGVVGIILIILGLRYLSARPEFAIENIIVEGNVSIDTQRVVDLAQEELLGSYGFIFSRANIVVYPRHAIERTIMKENVRIADVSIQRLLWNSIVIKITERAPVGVWCGSVLNSTEPCFVVDKEGFIFDQAPEFSGTTYIRFFGQISQAEPVGSFVSTKDRFTRVYENVSTLSTLSVLPTAVVFEDNEYTIVLTTGTHIRVIYDMNMSEFITTLNTILKQPQISEKGMHTVEYIDLRYGNKIFYKFKEKDGE